nr:hypothetical protein [Tanacetum cinerariifolium]
MQTQKSNTLHNAIMEDGDKDRPPMLAQVQIILIWIDNDIYSTVDACPNACEMWKAIERNQCDVTNHQVTVQFLLQLQPEWHRSQQASTRNRGKAIVNSPSPIYDQEPSMVAKDDEIANQDNSLRISRGTGYVNQRIVNVARDRETVARECQKPKRVKDAAYHKEKMLLCKQEVAGFHLSAEQADWRDDTDDKPED